MTNHVTEPTAAPAASQPETVNEIIGDVSSEIAPVLAYVIDTYTRVSTQIFSEEGMIQAAIILLALLIAVLLSRPTRTLLTRIWPTADGEKAFMKNTFIVLSELALPIVWVILLWIGLSGLKSFGVGAVLVRVLASMLQAWILIRLFSSFVRDPFWSRTFAMVAWSAAALNILKLLDPLIRLLDSFAITVGSSRLSAYMLIKGAFILFLLIWLASLISRFVQTRLGSSQNLTPSLKSLIGQGVRLGMLFAAVMIAMNIIGVDLTALAVFSGAVGVGIGFGLQAIFSNLVSGVIMLLEGSVKVGDFVELGAGLTGEVKEINTRSTLITTNDNIDILVPNSEFINGRVTNWTLRDSFRRVRVPFGVAYGTDKELVKKAALEAADACPHMLKGPKATPPQIWLVNFGASSLDFELVIWLTPEAVKRPNSVLADYNWALETALAKYGIEIPFPQRDLHIKSGSMPINLTAEVRDPEKPNEV